MKKKSIFLTLFLLSIASCGMLDDSDSEETTQQSRRMKRSKPIKAASECLCPEIDEPVCTKDGITLKNECLAKCQGLKYSYGSCF